MVRQADKDEAEKKKAEGGDFKTLEWNRSCTDTICCIIFLVFIVSLVAITGYAIKKGNPEAMITPFDSSGNQCGLANQGMVGSTKGTIDMKPYKYKYMYQLLTIATSKNDPKKWFQARCVKSCPVKGATSECIQDDGTTSGCPEATFSGDYGTHLVRGYCLPDKEAIKAVYGKLMEALSANSAFSSSMNDIQLCWKVVLGMCVATIFIALIYVFLLKWVVKPILYVSMVIILALFVLFGLWSFMKRQDYDPVTQKKNYDYATIGAGVGWGIAAIYAIFMCCCWKNISLGASIMEAASEFVAQNLRILILPIVSYLFALIFFAYWIVTCVFIYGIGDVKFDPILPIAKVENNKQVTYIFWYFLFGLLWVVAFFICLQQFIIAAMCCMWYFSGQGEEQSDAPGEVSMMKAIHWGTWFHCGSVAFGAFCIAVITMIRIVFEYLAAQADKVGHDNPMYKAVTCCIRCVLYCLDKYVKFITKNAFIQIALHNKAFCPAAWDSFWLIVRNAGRFGSATIIGWIMMILGKGTIMAVSGFITVLIIKAKYPDVQQPFLPAFFVIMVAYVVGSFFLSIFSFSCTAILHCFIMADDAGGNVPSPKSLQPFLDQHDKVDDKKDRPVAKPEDDDGDKKANEVG